MKLARLEDFGARKTVSPEERRQEYIKQCKELPARRQAKFWSNVLDSDPEVRKLCDVKEGKRRAK